MTGADSGIGRALAVTFVREGADVAIHAFGDRRGAKQTMHAVETHGRRSLLLETDFGDPLTAEGLVAQVVERLGRIIDRQHLVRPRADPTAGRCGLPRR